MSVIRSVVVTHDKARNLEARVGLFNNQGDVTPVVEFYYRDNDSIQIINTLLISDFVEYVRDIASVADSLIIKNSADASVDDDAPASDDE